MNDLHQDGIAIIGLTGRFPGAGNVDEFWRNLVAGVESIATFTDAELAAAGLDPAEVKNTPDYIRARGVLADADCFDAAFFGMNPKEAEATDPQQRAFLEAAWAALENAGYVPDRYRGAIGLFAGMTNNTYYLQNLHNRRDVTQLVGWLTTMMGNEKDYLATRVAYKLNLRGPALNIYTACSTSLVAVCQAVQNLQSYSCDIALAGGVSITFPQHRGYQYQEGGITSPDGHCRAFDVNAAGTVFSHGLGIVVLKRLAEAIADRDQIYAVIKGAALNNDGSNKVSFTAPSVDGQAEVVALAQALAGIDPGTISYIEAHGTGTPLGDPIEIAALTQAFRLKTARKNFCGIGTVKSNFGHLDAAAGIAGLIKTALALKHKRLPASLHFQKPNPKLELATSPFYVVDKLTDWQPGATPLRAGVSSFGVGGTNAHVVLEEAPAVAPSSGSRAAQLLLLSAKTGESLEAATAQLVAHFQAHPETNLADAAFTLQVGRASFNQRRILVCRDGSEVATALDATKTFSGQTDTVNPPVVFMFPGQGAQYVNMGVELYQSEPSFKADVDRGAELLQAYLGLDLRHVLFPAPDKVGWAEDQLLQTRITQPALFVIEYAMAKLWMAWGIQPAAMIGHSVGEYVAACLAGVFTFEEGLELVAGRAKLVQAQPAGAMFAVRLPEAELVPLLGDQLSIAAINAPNLCVVSGPHPAIAKLEQELAAKKIVGRRLNTSHAFHSAMMDPVVPAFTELVKKVRLQAPQVPYVSNVTANWVTANETTNPDYWAGHVRQAVRFADGVGELLKNQSYVMLEVGPGQTLAQLVRQHPGKGANQTVLASLAAAGLNSFLTALGRLWIAGVQPDWEAFYANEQRRRVALPTYAFEKKRYWVEPNPAATTEIIPWASPPSGTVMGGSAVSPVELPAVVVPVVDSTANRKTRLTAQIRLLVEELSGLQLGQVNPATGFLELGLDSLLLTQAATLFQRKLGVPVSFRQLMEDLGSIDALAEYADQTLPASASAPTVAPSPRPVVVKGHGPFRPIERDSTGGLTNSQQQWLTEFIARYTRRTAGSKALTEKNRPGLADPRSVAGFKQLWKEMVYPIYATRSDGARVWDVDGNEYIDFMMGFGASLFGHRPPFVVEAIQRQLELGFEIGPIQPMVGETAALVRELTGMERVAFCNTGSEAVLAAMRIARTVSGRDKIATFAGDYHGIFDEVLYRPLAVNGEPGAAPIAPGIPSSATSQLVVLEYGSAEALDWLRAHAGELAAVMVEPVQSRRLDLQPREFLHEVRRITEQTDTALIFDEVVTGFRVHPGGAQAHFGVRADIATYGKVIGGGLPIGVVAGSPKYLDALDGGQWQAGDASFPEVGVTFFAGTFVRHPITIAVAKAVLEHLKREGPALQERVASLAERAAKELREVIARYRAPLQLAQFSSLLYITLRPEWKLGGLLFYLLRDRGIHIFENRAFVFTTAHTAADLERLVAAVTESLAELTSAGFLDGHQSKTQTLGDGSIEIELTEAQREMWLGAQLGDRAALSYNITFLLHLKGQLNLPALERALQICVDRHDSLRASFDLKNPVQRFAPAVKLNLVVNDQSTVPAAKRPATLEKLARTQGETLFDLTCPPLLRAQLVRWSATDQVLVLTYNHLVADGWSFGVFLLELKQLYGGQPAELESALQFATYRGLLESPEYRAITVQDEAYWRQQFVELPPVLDLPADRPRPAQRSFRAGRVSVQWSPEFRQTLKQASARQGVTLTTYLLGAFKTLLHRLGAPEDFVVGIPAAGQMAAHLQATPGSRALIGHCVNLLPIRSQCGADVAFGDYLKTLKRTVLDAFDHQELSFGRLVQMLNVPRDPSRVPLMPVVFNLDRAPAGFELPGLETRVEELWRASLVFEFFLNIADNDRDLRLDCDFSTDLFDATTVERWLKHFRTLLEAAVAEPACLVGDLPLLTAAEQKQLVADSNLHPLPVITLHGLFEAAAAKTPDAPAVAYEGERLTYRELDRRATQIAGQLQQRGVGVESLVGICVERSLDMIVGILAILKAGGAYVPIDAAFPKERIAYVLDDAQVTVCLTQSGLLSKIPAERAICLDTLDWSAGRGATAVRVQPENLAYVIYTSGSTGRPKGVCIEHRNIVNYVLGVSERLEFTPGLRYALVSTIAADLGNTVVFPALATGGCLHIIAAERTTNQLALAEYFEREQIDVLKIVPSHLAALQSAANPERVLPRQRLILGGEASRLEWIERLRALAPGCVICNHYGPTETTVGVLTYRTRTPRQDTASGTLPLGRALPNSHVYILDQRLRPVPIGVAGELCIGGAGVARGYLNRSELTAEKFVADPFSEPGARMYRTGDRARCLTDGNIEFLGRIDDQVKVRGYRVELGEIEAALRERPDVRDAVVLMRENQLVGYVVPRQTHQALLGNRSPYVLPNGVPVAHLNKNETDYIYQEVFVLQAYLRHGITIRDGDCIVDAGSNIGLFTVFANRLARDLRMFSFEPNPSVFRCLEANARAHGTAVKCFPCGLSRENKMAEMTFFEGFSLLSGFYADEKTEREVVKTFVLNQQSASVSAAQVDELLEERFHARQIQAQLRTLSDVIAEERIERIDLLKVNVEKSELDILLGLTAGDWAKIRQLVIEVDQQGNLAPIVALLEQYGFEHFVEQDPLLRKTELCYVYAIRPSPAGRLIREQAADAHLRVLPAWAGTVLTPGMLQEYLAERLPDYMVPPAYVLLEALPLNANGKLDRQSLPAPESAATRQRKTERVAPRTSQEQMIAEVWEQVLKVPKVGIHDNFFELGGDSLLAIQVVSRVNQSTNVRLVFPMIFEHPTVTGLATALMELQLQGEDPEELARLMAELEGMSDAEAAAQLKGGA